MMTRFIAHGWSKIIGLLCLSSPLLAMPLITAPTFLMVTAYTDQTLPTLQRGDHSSKVKILQQLLLSNGFLGAAGARLHRPRATVADGVFGSVTQSAIRDLQQRYELPITGIVNPVTWEVLDRHENPYRAPLPWRHV